MLMTAHYQRFQAHRKGSSWPAWPCFSLLGDLEKGLQLGPQHPPNALVFIGPRCSDKLKGQELLRVTVLRTERPGLVPSPSECPVGVYRDSHFVCEGI